MAIYHKKRLKIRGIVKTQPKQHISIFKGILYGIGCGFGASIFLLLGEWIVFANFWIFLSLILAAIIIFLSSLNYSELMVSLHVEGGVYNIGKEGVGGTFAFINGFFLWISNITVSTFSAEVLNQTIIKGFPFLKDFNLILVFLLVGAIGLLSFYAKKFSTNLLIGLTVILLIIFGIFIISVFITTPSHEIVFLDPNPINLLSKNIFGVFQTFIFLLILFKGIMLNLAQVDLDLNNINKNIPRVNLLSVIISVVIYFIIFLAVFFKINGFSRDFLMTTDNLMAAILYQSIGVFGYFLMYMALIISTIITINASLSSATGVFKALVRDGYFSSTLFMKEDQKNEFSVITVLITIIVAILFIIIIPSTGFTDEIIIFIYFFSIAFINFAAVRLRYRRKELDRPFKAPFFPYLPLIIGVLFLVFSFLLSIEAVILGIIIGILGALIYLLLIADRYSKIITLSGIKFVSIFMVGMLIWVINNSGIVYSSVQGGENLFLNVLLRILVFFTIFGFISVFFDIFSIREIVNFFTKRFKKDTVAINVGTGKIIDINRRGKKITYIVKYLIGILEIMASFFIYALIFILFTDLIIVAQLDFGAFQLNALAIKYLLITTLFTFSTTFFLRGVSRVYYNLETVQINI